MSDIVYVYVDDNKIIREIEFESNGDFVDYDLILIPKNQAQEVLTLKQKWIQNINSKQILSVLNKTPTGFTVLATTYIYYNDKDRSIKAFSPRRQPVFDNDETLHCGMAIVDDLVIGFRNGTKNSLNYKVNNVNYFLTLEEIERTVFTHNVLESIIVIDDYMLEETITDDTKMIVRYDGETLTVKKIKEVDDATHTLFFIDRYNKFKLYDRISFNLSSRDMISFPLNIKEEFFIISQYKKNMIFIRDHSHG